MGARSYRAEPSASLEEWQSYRAGLDALEARLLISHPDMDWLDGLRAFRAGADAGIRWARSMTSPDITPVSPIRPRTRARPGSARHLASRSVSWRCFKSSPEEKHDNTGQQSHADEQHGDPRGGACLDRSCPEL